MTGLEVAAAVVLGSGVLWLVLGPLTSRRVPPAPIDEAPPLEETGRGQALAALNEIEFDHATGKLSEEDYADLRLRHVSRAAAILRAEEIDPAERLVASQVASRTGAIACPACGPRPERDAAYCSSCGAPLGHGG